MFKPRQKRFNKCEKKLMPSATKQDRAGYDGANLYATARTLGFDIDYKRLLLESRGRGTLVRAFYYTAIIEIRNTRRSARDRLAGLHGYSVVTKRPREFVDAFPAAARSRATWTFELAVDADGMADSIDQMCLFSGDGDFRSLVEAVQRRGVRVTVISTIAASRR